MSGQTTANGVKVALVTGSTNGLGVVIANTVAARGCEVIIHGLGEPDKIEEIRSSIQQKHKTRVTFVGGDLSNGDEIDNIYKEVSEIYPNGIDILINNAGYGMWDTYPVEYYPRQLFEKVMAINATAPFHLVQKFLPAMKEKKWGRVVNIASTEGQVGNSHYLSAYSASKHALIGLTKCVALENATSGVPCNAVCPHGISGTAMMEHWHEKVKKKIGQDIPRDVFEQTVADSCPLKQTMKPEKIADLVQFLCFSEASSQMTGACYNIDGGYTAQ